MMVACIYDYLPVCGSAHISRPLGPAFPRALRSLSGPVARPAPRRRPGAPRLRELVDPERATTFTRAQSEELLLALIRRGGLPAPETNVLMTAVEVDFLWRDERVIVEVDGWASHGTPAAFERDRRRDATLENEGWRVIRITWRQLTKEPEAVLVTIATALALRQ
jgi:very-short-patch-repair endonuclease